LQAAIDYKSHEMIKKLCKPRLTIEKIGYTETWGDLSVVEASLQPPKLTAVSYDVMTTFLCALLIINSYYLRSSRMS